jgi:hypothetical protein
MSAPLKVAHDTVHPGRDDEKADEDDSPGDFDAAKVGHRIIGSVRDLDVLGEHT